ncbi:MAG: hypothetical protein RLZ92_1987 [Pseudomonadota bacterium]
MENKKILSIAGAFSVGFAVWIGASIYAAKNTEVEIKTMLNKTASQCDIRITNLQHEQGLIASAGQFLVHVGDQCNIEPSERDWLVAQVDYRTNSLILPHALMRFDWTLKQLSTEVGAIDSQLQFEGSGKVSLTKIISSNIKSLEIAGSSDEQNWRVEPFIGDVEWGSNSVVFNLKTPRLVSRGGGSALDLQGVGVQVDMQNRELGIGKSAFSIDKMSTSTATAEGLSFSGETVENADRLEAKLNYGLRSLESLGYSAHALAMEIAIKGLHAESVKKLAQITDQASFQNLTAEEQTQYRAALRQLIAQGVTMGISKLSGTVTNGGETSQIDGNLIVNIRPNSDANQANIQLAKLLESSGQLIFNGKAIDAGQKQQIVQMGFARATPEGLKADYEYSAGILKTNGRIIDDSFLQEQLINVDNQINDFLSGQVNSKADENQATVIQPIVEIPVETENQTLPEINENLSETAEAEVNQVTNVEAVAAVVELVKPSFDCNKASSTAEKLICSSSQLSKLDVELNGIFKQALANAADPKQVINSQKAWIKNLRGLCSDVECMSRAYQQRLEQLASN